MSGLSLDNLCAGLLDALPLMEAVIERARGGFLMPGYRKSSPAPCPFNDMGAVFTRGPSRLSAFKQALSDGMAVGRAPISGTPV